MARTLIVGAGLAGAAVAHAVGGDVIVVEQGARPAAEASAQNAGMIRRLVEDPIERRLALRAFERLVETDAWEVPPSRTTGAVLALDHDPAHLHDGVAHLRAHGVPIEALSRPVPALVGARFAAAWWLPQARVADAQALVRGLLERSGAELRCGLRVEQIRVDGGRVTGVRTDQGELAADRVVIAAGAWAQRLSAGLDRPLTPLRRSVWVSAPHPLATADHPWCWIDDAGLYVRPRDGRFLVCACEEVQGGIPQGPGSTGAPTARARTWIQERLQHLPALADLALVEGWSGLRTFAPDRRPLLGEDPELPGLWWAAGIGGFGVTTSLAVGELIATWMRGESVDWIRRDEVSPGRFHPQRWPIRSDGTLANQRLIRRGDPA